MSLGIVSVACGPRPGDDDPNGQGGTSQGGSSGTAGQGTSGCGVNYTLKDGGSTRPPTTLSATPSLQTAAATDGGVVDASNPNNLRMCFSIDELATMRGADAGPAPGDGTPCPQVTRTEYPNFPADWVMWRAYSAGVQGDLCCYDVGPSCS